jgi:hypothetical protein
MLLKRKHLQWVGISCLILGLVVSLFLGIYRWQAEKEYNAVEILLDYDQMKTLAVTHQLSWQTLAAQFHEAGATGVVVRERTLADLDAQGDLLVLRGNEVALQQSLNPEFLPTLTPVKENTYIFIQDQELFREIYQNMVQKKEGIEVIPVGDWQVISLNLSAQEWEKLGVGFPRADLQEIKTGGLTIVPRIRSWQGANQTSLDVLTASWGDLPGLSMFTFNDDRIPGDAGYLAHKLQGANVPVGIFEFYAQQGLTNLARSMGKNAVRIHCINENEMKKNSESSALARFNLAVSERNIRMLYVRLFGLEQPTTALANGLDFISRVKANIEAEGLVVGSVKSLPSIPYSRLLVLVVGLGVVGGGLLFLNYFLAPHWTALLSLGGLLGWVGLLYFQPLFARKVFALLAVIIFPVLAVVKMVRKEKRTAGGAVKALLLMTGISFCGAILMTGLLADKAFMLKLDQFSGVKLAHVVPLLILPLYFFLKYSDRKPLTTMREILNTPLLVWHVIAGLLLLLIVAIYLLRTGNGVPGLVSSWEIKFRELLDSLLLVRPRTKEFLIGHPLMLLLLYSGYSHQKLPLLFLGIIGQISVVNTYAHLHTPLEISFLRSFHGLWLGVLLGLMLLIVVRFTANVVIRRLNNG